MENNESARVRKLRQALKVATDKAMSGADIGKVLKCFPGLADESRVALVSEGYAQLQDLFKTSVQNEFDLIIEETNIKDSLLQLDDLLTGGKSSDSHSAEAQESAAEYDPDASIRHSVMPLKLAERQRLLQALEQVNKENSRLNEGLAISRQALSDQQTLLTTRMAQFSEAAKVCSGYCDENVWSTARY